MKRLFATAAGASRKRATPPAPISCAYPLDASEAAVIAAGMAGRLTLSNANQTGSYISQGGLGAGVTYGMFSGASATIDFAGTNKAIEIEMVAPAIVGPGTSDPDFYTEVSFYAPGFTNYLRVQVSCTDGTRQLNISKGVGGNIGSEVISADASTIGLVFNGGTVKVILNNTEITLSDNNWADTTLLPLCIVRENAGADAADAGKTFSITLRTDATNFVGTGYPVGTTDVCGTAV